VSPATCGWFPRISPGIPVITGSFVEMSPIICISLPAPVCQNVRTRADVFSCVRVHGCTCMLSGRGGGMGWLQSMDTYGVAYG